MAHTYINNVIYIHISHLLTAILRGKLHTQWKLYIRNNYDKCRSCERHFLLNKFIFKVSEAYIKLKNYLPKIENKISTFLHDV